MKNLTYVLDSNVIIKLWNDYPKLFDDIIEQKSIEFIVPKPIAAEVSKKEYTFYKGVSVLSERFLRLMPYILEDTQESNLEVFCTKIGARKMHGGISYYIDENKISEIDFMLLYICNNTKNSILVTQDKKLSLAGKKVLGDNRVEGFKNFLEGFI